MTSEHGLSILSLGEMKLAFPLSEVAGIRRCTEMEAENPLNIPLSLGCISHAGHYWPVFQLNDLMQPEQHIDPCNGYCLCLSADNNQTGVALLCETVNSVPLHSDGVQPIPLQACMQRAVTPIQQLFLHMGQLLAVSSTANLATYLRTLADGQQLSHSGASSF